MERVYVTVSFKKKMSKPVVLRRKPFKKVQEEIKGPVENVDIDYSNLQTEEKPDLSQFSMSFAEIKKPHDDLENKTTRKLEIFDLQHELGLTDKELNYQESNVATLGASDLRQIFSKSYAKNLKESFKQNMEDKDKEYNQNQSKNLKSEVALSNVFSYHMRSFLDQMKYTSKIVKRNAYIMTLLEKQKDQIDQIRIDQPLLDINFYEQHQALSVYLDPKEDSQDLNIADIIDLKLDYITTDGNDEPEPTIDVIAKLEESLELSRKKKSKDLSIIDVSTHDGIEFIAYVAAFILTGLKGVNITSIKNGNEQKSSFSITNLWQGNKLSAFSDLLSAVDEEVQNEQLVSVLNTNMHKAIEMIKENQSFSGRKGTIEAIYTLLKKHSLSQFIDSIRISPHILHTFYFDDSLIGNQEFCNRAFDIIQQAEISKFVGDLPNSVPDYQLNSCERIVNRFRTTMDTYSMVARDAQLAGDQENNESLLQQYIIDAMRLTSEVILTGKGSSTLNVEIIWILIVNNAFKEPFQPHEKFSLFQTFITKRRAGLASTSTRFYGFIVDCFNNGLAPYILPFLSNMGITPSIMLNRKSAILQIAHYLKPLETFFHFNPDEVIKILEI